MRRLFQYVLVGAVAVGGAAGLAACDGDGDKKAEDIVEDLTGEDVDINEENGEVQISSDEGEFSVGSSEVPDDFPEDVPLPEDAKLTGSSSFGSEGETTWTLVYSLDNADDVGGAMDAYKSQLEDAGFTIEGESSGSSNGAEFGTFTATNDDYTVSVYAGGDVTMEDEAAFTVSVATTPSE